MTDYADDDITMKPEPDAPHVVLAACVQGQHITQWEYDVLTSVANCFGRTLAQHIRQTLTDQVEWWEATGEPKPEVEENPYILHGEELERTEERRKAGLP